MILRESSLSQERSITIKPRRSWKDLITCRSKVLKQVATAVGEGANAAFIANEYVQEKRHKRAETKSLGYDQM